MTVVAALQPRDWPSLTAIEADAFGPRSWGEKGLRATLATNGSHCVVAYGQNLDGFAIYRDLGSDIELLHIGVARGRRRQGVGAALLGVVMDAARKAKAGSVFLEVAADNDNALMLYRKAGFQEVGLRRAYYRNGADALIMRIAL